jgi:hypothetical protein
MVQLPISRVRCYAESAAHALSLSAPEQTARRGYD